jgi:hypothetical protein
MLLRTIPLLLLFLTSLPTPSLATTVRYVELPEMSRQCPFIFHGTVTDVTARNLGSPEHPRIVTDVTFDVHRVLKGTTKGPQFTLRLIGGTVDGVTLAIPGGPRFAPQDEVVLFLEWTGESYAINGMRQGLYRVSRDENGNQVAQRSLEELCIMLPDRTIEHRFKPEPPRPLQELFEAVRKATREVTK